MLLRPNPVDVLRHLRDMALERRPDDPLLAELLPEYWSAAPDDDVAGRTLDDMYAVAATHLELARFRAIGTTLVKVVSPEAERDGWSSAHSVVLVAADDAPFAVDTLRMAIERHGIGIHLLVHPMFSVSRDDNDQLVAVGPAHGEGPKEAWTQIEIDRVDASVAVELEAAIRSVESELEQVVADFPAMRQAMVDLADQSPLLDWLVADEFVFLGSASYRRGESGLEPIPGTALGQARGAAPLDPPVLDDDRQVVIARTDATATIHRPSRQMVVMVRVPSSDGDVVEHRFTGLLASTAYRVSVFDIPAVGDAIDEALNLDRAGRHSYLGRAARTTVETLPRELVLELAPDAVADLVWNIVGLQDRRLVRVFHVPEPLAGRATVLVYLPRSRFTADLPGQVATLVAEAYDATDHDVESFVGSSSLARIAVAVEGVAGRPPDAESLAAAVDELSTAWLDRLQQSLSTALGAVEGSAVLDLVGRCAPSAYRTAVAPERAVADLAKVARLVSSGDDLTTSLGREVDAPPREWRLRVFRRGRPVTLADLLPLLGSLGIDALDERSYRFPVGSDAVHLHDIGVRVGSSVVLDDERRGELQRAFAGLVAGELEHDQFNRLVLAAGLTVAEVAVIRAYARYLRQVGFAFSESYISDTLVSNGPLVRLLVDRFRVRFDPTGDGGEQRTAAEDALRQQTVSALDAIVSLDEDRICRAFHTLIDATVRTNWFRGGNTVAFKFDPALVPDLPMPRPRHEIWVCGPTVEGVHLRGGLIARGGLRWSDRREDFRTEILGLMKAQMVKNALIVPTGAKGGFVVKQVAPGIGMGVAVAAAYRTLVSSLLELTDNLVGGVVVHPANCVVLDGDDPYLVVAADKGTATFSDLANEVAAEYGYWAGDAFASGGSAGYDHKEMGITARGAWESARRHGSDLGRDVDVDPITVVGIGDMSGDVFGNGMLLSKALRLVAAFDHRHIFVDPHPEPDVSFAERQRLFDAPGSSWDDYDRSLLSGGGGIYARSLKHIRLSPEAADVLGAPDQAFTPNELISVILRAPVDLLWNGGVGTYVKASSESNADAGDRTNDAVRVNGADLRCRMVVEGGNLGVTQLGRVEFALGGGLVNTDAIDNSGGVDCSDHEVNIKIALRDAIASGTLAAADRNDLLAVMTDEVAGLVLAHNRAQNLALAIARRQALPMVNVHARYIEQLESEGWLDRSLEFLPTDRQLAERSAGGGGLTVPEFSVLIAYTKNANTAEMLRSELPDLPVLDDDLVEYFPTVMRERFRTEILGHQLRREIIATTVVNQMVNLSGISFDHRVTEDTGASVVDVTRAWLVARDVFDVIALWNHIDALTGRVPNDVQMELFLDCRRMVERAVLWLIRHRRPPFDVAGAIERFRPGITELAGSMGDAIGPRLSVSFDSLEASRLAAGVPEQLAERASVWPVLHTGLDLIEVADRVGSDVATAAGAYWDLFERLDVGWLWDGIGTLPRSDRWQTQARSAMRDDLLAALADLSAIVLDSTDGSVERWLDVNERQVNRAGSMLLDIRRAGVINLTTTSVALRQLRNLALTSVSTTSR